MATVATDQEKGILSSKKICITYGCMLKFFFVKVKLFNDSYMFETEYQKRKKTSKLLLL